MPHPYRVKFEASAEADMRRVFDFLLDRAQTLDDLANAQADLDSLRAATLYKLAESPWAYRKAGTGRRTTRRELVVPSRTSGYIVLFEIGAEVAVVLAVRHQLEQDYH
jgi:plasmid stabilization system protein ParE